MEEAYLVQAEVYRLMQAHAGFSGFAGHKVALTSPAIQEMCGVDQPAYGSILSEFVHANQHGADPNEFIRLGIEFEVAVEIAEDLPMGTEHSKESVTEHIGAVSCIEMNDDFL